MLKKYCIVLFASILAAVLIIPFAATASDVTLQNAPAQVHFSPGTKQAQAVAKEMENATMEILVQSSSLDSPQIVKALQNAAKRAVSVEVMVDRSRQADKGGSLRSLVNAKIPVLVDSSHAAAYNEVIIIDKTTVITGAFALSAAGEKNAGNMLIVKSKDLTGLYLDNWLAHKGHARPFQARATEKAPVKKKRRS